MEMAGYIPVASEDEAMLLARSTISALGEGMRLGGLLLFVFLRKVHSPFLLIYG